MRVHSWVSPKCAAGVSPLGGRGVFAAAPIAAGELVCVWGGVVVTTVELAEQRKRGTRFEDTCIAIEDGFWLASPDPTRGDDSELFNHSCDPNLGIKGQVVLVARRPIADGEEVTFDYETVETDLSPFRCECGSPHCRGVIDGTASRDPEFRRRHTGYLSWYIERVPPAASASG